MMKCPDFVKLRSYLQQCQATNKKPIVDSQLLELMHWLVQPRNFQLKSCDKAKVIHSFIHSFIHILVLAEEYEEC